MTNFHALVVAASLHFLARLVFSSDVSNTTILTLCGKNMKCEEIELIGDDKTLFVRIPTSDALDEYHQKNRPPYAGYLGDMIGMAKSFHNFLREHRQNPFVSNLYALERESFELFKRHRHLHLDVDITLKEVCLPDGLLCALDVIVPNDSNVSTSAGGSKVLDLDKYVSSSESIFYFSPFQLVRTFAGSIKTNYPALDAISTCLTRQNLASRSNIGLFEPLFNEIIEIIVSSAFCNVGACSLVVCSHYFYKFRFWSLVPFKPWRFWRAIERATMYYANPLIVFEMLNSLLPLVKVHRLFTRGWYVKSSRGRHMIMSGFMLHHSPPEYFKSLAMMLFEKRKELTIEETVHIVTLLESHYLDDRLGSAPSTLEKYIKDNRAFVDHMMGVAERKGNMLSWEFLGAFQEYLAYLRECAVDGLVASAADEDVVKIVEIISRGSIFEPGDQ